MRRFLITLISAATALLLASPALAATLYAVSGEHPSEPNPESLYTLDQFNGSATFLKAFGAGSDGETIAYDSDANLLYHASGAGAQNDAVNGEILETFDPATLAVSNVPLSGTDYSEAVALTYDDTSNALLLADLNNGFYQVSTAGVVSSIGTLDHDAKGLAFSGGTLYSVDRDTDQLRTINPATGATLTSIAIALAGEGVNGATGLATDPDTGILWALLKLDFQASDRRLVTIDPTTGTATNVGGTGHRMAGIAFGNAPIPEPSTALLLGFGLVGLALRRNRHSPR